MKKLQCSRAAKACAVLILLLGAYGAGIFAASTLIAAESVISGSWQSGRLFHSALEERCRTVQEGVDQYLELRRLEQAVKDGEENILTQADQDYLQEELDRLREQFDRNSTWFRYRLMTADGRQLLDTNLVEGEALARVVQGVHGFRFMAGSLDWQEATEHPADGTDAELLLEYGVPEGISDEIQDEFYNAYIAYKEGRVNFDVYLTGFLNMGAFTLLALVFILWSCGHKAGEEGIVLTWQEKIFFDLYLCAMCLAGIWLGACGIFCVEQMVHIQGGYELQFYLMQAGAGFSWAGFAGAAALTLRTLAVRLKAHVLTQTTLLCRVVTWTAHTVHVTTSQFLQNIPFIWKSVAVFFLYCLFTLFVIAEGHYSDFIMFLWILVNAAAAVALGWWAIGLHRLREGTRAIASGELDYKIDTTHMPMDLRSHAEDLNNISVGMHSAVDEQMKSERFKAELITNVSHDLKTPLTSIINYVNLLQTTEQTDPKAAEYIEVLDRKSQRLKKLTEDLVEASKASTGVLPVNREKIGLCQLVDQALGEYEEKLEARRLRVIRTVPEEEVYVYADGRHLWRVIDNLLANCAKYAMEGTRIYVEVSRGQGKGMFQVKNISKDPLNVPVEQLMERFVRGDASRSTEGSGLGLSIARSLTELQAGSFDLAVDGDLFKAVVALPQYGG